MQQFQTESQLERETIINAPVVIQGWVDFSGNLWFRGLSYRYGFVCNESLTIVFYPTNTMPSSSQNLVGNSKAAKFVAANPLAPLANPFAGMDDDSKELHQQVSNDVQKRLQGAIEDLQERHRTGTNELDDVDRAPTGAIYRTMYQQQRQLAKDSTLVREKNEARERLENNQRIEEMKERMRRMKFHTGENDYSTNTLDQDESDVDSDEDDEDDPELERLRQARWTQLQQQQRQRAEHLSLGHGTLRSILQDEFLKECTGSSRYVCVHFFHDDFERCKVMDFHLKIIAQDHLECKFLRIDAAKAPFFVNKLRIKTLPVLLVFDHGKEIGRLTGFEGLSINPNKPDEWHTGRLQEWIAEKGAIKYEKSTEEVEEERQRLGLVMRGSVYSDRNKNHLADE